MIITVKRFFAAGSGDTVGADIEISDGENLQRASLKLLATRYAALRPERGEISRDFFELLEEEDRLCKAYLSGLNILSFGSNTAHTLRLKLRRRGFDAGIAGRAVEMLSSKGYINEDEDFKRDIERCLRKGWGSRRILSELHKKGYDDEALALAEDELSQLDFGEYCLNFLQSHRDDLPTDTKEKQKLIASLVRYGYSMSEIKFAFASFKEP